MNNKLIIAAAGSGKTTFLVNQALSITSERILITTFTEANEQSIKEMFVKKNGCVPSNVVIQTWFSFLLQHGVRPFQDSLDDRLHNIDIGFFLVSEKSAKKYSSGGRTIYWAEADIKNHYFTITSKIFSDKISKFVLYTNTASNGAVVSRVSRIFDHIFIDEIQDLVGYDLDLIKTLFKSKTSILLVGDPRQVTYLTHFTSKYGKYADGGIKKFIENELGGRIRCEIDETTLSVSHRNNKIICEYSSKLYPDLSASIPCSCPLCRSHEIGHNGIFLIKKQDVDNYLETYKPMQLRWNIRSKCNALFPVKNLGDSKGLSFDRVLIYPTDKMLSWIKDNNYELPNETKAKFYVGITRARFSVAIVMDHNSSDDFDGVENYSIS